MQTYSAPSGYKDLTSSDPTNRVPDFSVHETVQLTQTVSCLICRSGCIDREEELNECNYVELRK